LEMEGIEMKIKVHNSLSLTNKDCFWIDFLLNDTYLQYYSKDEKLYFWSKISDYPIGSLIKDGSLKEFPHITLDPFDLKRIKILKWKELKS